MFNFLKKIFRRKIKIIKANSLLDVVKFLLNNKDFLELLNESKNVNDLYGTGMWIRNHFGLWIHDTPLRSFFLKRKIWHPDDMSGIILVTTFNYHKGIVTNFEEECETYFNHWKQYKIGENEILESLSKKEKKIYLENINNQGDYKWSI